MKAVLMSIKPKWCELIASGNKTVEVRKTAPKEVPFKVYIYETKAGFIEAVRGTCPKCAFSRGKVIGEFVCDKVEKIPAFFEKTEGTCLTIKELDKYGYDKKAELYYWRISELKIYDEPKELSEFKKYNRTCYFSDLGHAIPNCKTCRVCNLTRPPQSWCYVEEIEE